jgi:hypothetical protein
MSWVRTMQNHSQIREDQIEITRLLQFLNIVASQCVLTKQSDEGRGCRPGGSCTTSEATC